MSGRDTLDPPTLELVRLAAIVAEGHPPDIAAQMAAAREAGVESAWIEELLLQTHLMCGFPRMLGALQVYRREFGSSEATPDPGRRDRRATVRRGERVCAAVYADHYDALRRNVHALHPAVDQWMISHGYGTVLGRPGLDLLRRELCVIAQVAVMDEPRPLRSHLRGALLLGASPGEIEAVLSVVNPLLPGAQWRRVKSLWKRVQDRELPP